MVHLNGYNQMSSNDTTSFVVLFTTSPVGFSYMVVLSSFENTNPFDLSSVASGLSDDPCIVFTFGNVTDGIDDNVRIWSRSYTSSKSHLSTFDSQSRIPTNII